MKTLLLTFIFLFVATFLTVAQECEIYFPIQKDTGFEMRIYTAKDKLSGLLKYKVVDTRKSPDLMEATIESKFFDKKGEEQYSANYEVRCDGQNVYVDMSSYFVQQMKAYKNMNITMESEDYILPSNLHIGEELNDAQVVATIHNNGSRFGSITLRSQNKSVTAEETITVPAGSFNCYKIEGTMVSVSETVGIPIKFELRNVEWYAKGIGLVKSESFGKNGKLLGYTVLHSRF